MTKGAKTPAEYGLTAYSALWTWGKVPAKPYGTEALATLKQTLAEILGTDFKPFA